ncbi:MAG TPA: hypothetical protein VD862_03330 [Candidatus Paceibacterota bacterium]|nr:hypothetical protein [Candidatus Paceibacterota bacterium]
MKVIRKGNGRKSWAGKRVTCPACQCQFALEAKDHLRLVPDNRDGDYYEVPCPECGHTIAVAAELLNRAPEGLDLV